MEVLDFSIGQAQFGDELFFFTSILMIQICGRSWKAMFTSVVIVGA